MQYLYISLLGVLLFLVTIFIFKNISKEINFFRRLGLIISLLASLFLIVIGIINYNKLSPFIYSFDISNKNYQITFPGEPHNHNIENVKESKIFSIDGNEYILVIANLGEIISMNNYTALYEKKISNSGADIFLKEIKESESYYIITPNKGDYYVFKKFILEGTYLFDFTVKSTNQFPNEIEERFLNYQIEEL